jgi:GR25 family glycosyltransferase involved in LPS biosynthesis
MLKLSNISVPNIINLKECRDRMKYMRDEFLKLGIEDIQFHQFDRYNNNTSIQFTGDQELINSTSKGVASSHLLTIKWWLDNTDESIGLFFEDDVDFEHVHKWNFTFNEFIERCGDSWDALQLCIVCEYPYDVYNKYPVMTPRPRNLWDHGLQCYVLKREYAQKLVNFYFNENNSINLRMPDGVPISVENNVLCGFGNVVTFPLFNHNITNFYSKNIYTPDGQSTSSIHSYEYIKNWWERVGYKMNLEQIFNNTEN